MIPDSCRGVNARAGSFEKFEYAVYYVRLLGVLNRINIINNGLSA